MNAVKCASRLCLMIRRMAACNVTHGHLHRHLRSFLGEAHQSGVGMGSDQCAYLLNQAETHVGSNVLRTRRVRTAKMRRGRRGSMDAVKCKLRRSLKIRRMAACNVTHGHLHSHFHSFRGKGHHVGLEMQSQWNARTFSASAGDSSRSTCQSELPR